MLDGGYVQFAYTPAASAPIRLIEVRDPLGNSTRVEYNPQGLVSRVIDPRNQATQFAYDLNDLASITDPLGRTVSFFTDPLGRVLQVTDPLGNRSSRTWDKLHRVLTSTDPQGSSTAFTWDENGNATSFTDPRGGITGWTWDSKNRVSVRTDPLTRTETFTYDGEDNLLTHTDRKGQITTHTYDELGRRNLTTWHGGATTAMTYDAADRLTQVTDSVSGTITRTYDDRFDTAATEVAPLGASTSTLTYAYDAAGRRTQMQVTGQSAVTYGYDDANRLTGITQGTNAVTFAYDAASRRTLATLPNGVTIDYGYDNANQLTSLTYKRNGIALGDLSYTYDAAGRRRTMGGTFARVNLPPALTSATYDAANKLTNWAGTTLSYDNNGNLVSDGSRTHTWDSRDRLTGLNGGGITSSYAYDAFDRRISRTLNGAQLGTVYDGQREVHTATGSTINNTLLNGPGLDERYASTQGGNTNVILPDALRSTLHLLSPGGSLSATFTYEPYGTATQSGTDNTQYRYTGREDDGTGLMYYRARYYNPRIGRFISEDPIGLAGGMNLYGYVAGDPIARKDPRGLDNPGMGPYQYNPFDPNAEESGLAPVCVECLIPTARVPRAIKWIADRCRESNKPQRPDPWASPDGRPGPDWHWRGGEKGSWVRGERGKDMESIWGRVDDSSHGPHYDYKGPTGEWRIYQDGRWEVK